MKVIHFDICCAGAAVVGLVKAVVIVSSSAVIVEASFSYPVDVGVSKYLQLDVTITDSRPNKPTTCK